MKSILVTFLATFIIGGVLVFIWFKDGYILGTVESQIPFYNLTRFYDQVKLAWSENNPGLGFANGIVTAYTPTFFVLSSLERIGIPDFIIEACFFYFLLVTASLGVALLTQELFPKISWKYLLIASLFYWFNPLSLVNIWNRFLYNYMALWALLPLATAFYIKGIKKQNFIYIFATGTLCAIFSLGLSNPVFNIVLWLAIIFITLFYFFTSNTKKSKLFYFLYFIFSLIYFCLTNLWWIGQVVRYILLGKYSEEITTFFPDKTNLTTFDSLSKILGDLTYLFRFLHKSFFNTTSLDWAGLLITPWAVTMEFLITGVILLCIVSKRRDVSVLFLGLFLITSLYFVKGSNPPFGDLFRFLFMQITPLQFFRNSFEKFGFLVPLAAAPLLAAGLEDLSLRFRKKMRFFLYVSFLGIIVGFLGFPFWSGLVFTNVFPPTNDYSVGYKVKVPDYYKEASDWLQLQGNNFRFLGFPSTNQGITYKWEKGYQGIETSMWLFSTPNITFTTTLLYFDKVSSQLEKIFMRTPDFYKVMNILNAKYLMVRSDVDFNERNIRDPKKIIEISNKYMQEGSLGKLTSFGKLGFWENPYWEDKTVYVADSLIKISPEIELGDFTLPEVASSAAAYQQARKSLDKMVSLEIIHPTKQKAESKLNPYKSKFEIKNSGSYELLVNLPAVRVDDKKIIDKPILRTDGRLSYDKLDFTAGFHEVELTNQLSDNLAIRIANTNDYTVLDFDPFSKYSVSFDYSIKGSQKESLEIFQDNDQLKNGSFNSSYIRELSNNPNEPLISYQDIYEPRDTAGSIKVIFSPQLQDNLFVKNMSIKKIVQPEAVLIRKNEDLAKKVPNLVYKKVSPTYYELQIKNAQNPFVLVFSSIFSPGWEIKYSDGLKANDHFLVNSYANGWMIDKKGDYNLVLDFSLQDNLKQDSIISAASFIFGVLVLLTALFLKLKSK